LKSLVWIGALLLLLFVQVSRADSFTVDRIEIVGAKKISEGTLLNYLPLNVGEQLDEERSPELIRELYSTGFFESIELLRDDNVLIIKVRERPSIAEINIEGNDDIDDEALNGALNQMGMTRGKIFNKLLLSKLELELQQLYYSQGKYAVKLKSDWRHLDDDRVAIDITISEGKPALIRSINITGNEIFDEETLQDNFELQAAGSGWFSSDKYSSSKLSGDLENLNSYYLDRGYVQFRVESKQVTITPDRKDINITVNISEGEQFTIRSVDMTGELVVDRAELMALVPFREGDLFSRKKVTNVVSLISRRLGEEGYAFADVRPLPELNEEDNTIDLKYVINPGKRMTVRYINFIGNDRTRTSVLRREMRQFESEVYRASKVDRSRIRLQRLNYLTSVDIKTVPVEGHDDQVDLEITVAERFSGSVQVGLGFSATQGAVLNLGLTHDNIFGTGKTISFTFDNSRASERYGFRYLNPYYTADGVSRGFRFTYTATDSAENNTSDYLIGRISLSMDYGIPLSEFNTLTVEFGLEQNEIKTTSGTPDEIYEFIIDNSDEYDENTDPANVTGAEYNSLFSAVSFSKDTRNKRVFADSGSLNTVRLEMDGGDLNFYKLRYNHRTNLPVVYDVTFTFRGRFGYGDSYSETTDLPFFEKFYAGGVRSVRGYERNSLGPLDSNGNPFGGNFQTILSTEFLMPVEAIASSESFRVGLYFDAGNVFATVDAFEAAELRASVGLSAKWFSVIGPLEFSLAQPINDQAGDRTEIFQFALGASF